ncbi:MAG: hypothetical protein CMJ78_26870 [Planctomycetaceae bacterium]|nr:hypothetical protein [Planctomycetaceae bacterium]
MMEFEREMLKQYEDWRTVLEAYRDHQLQLKETDPEFDGWIPRLTSFSGMIVPDELSEIHGKLIALGLIKVQLENRAGGVRYQVTRQGREMLGEKTHATESECAA